MQALRKFASSKDGSRTTPPAPSPLTTIAESEKFSFWRFSSILSLLIFSSFLVRPVPEFIPGLVLLSSVFLFLATSLRPKSFLILLGLAILSLPMLRAGALELGILSLILGLELRRIWRPNKLAGNSHSVATYLLLLQLVVLAHIPGLVLGVSKSFDDLVFSSVYQSGGFYGLYRWLLVNSQGWFAALDYFKGILVAGLLGWYVLTSLGQANLESRAKLQESLLKGLLLGSSFAALVLFLQVSNFIPFASFNRSPFFISEGRYPASFSDPNAFGVVVAFLIPFLSIGIVQKLAQSRFSASYFFVVFALAGSALWSGSRTLWLGLASYLVIIALALKSFSLKSWLILALFLSSFLVLLGQPELNQSIQSRVEAPGVQRVLETLNWDTARESFKSRLIFGRLALAVWQDAPWFGAGLGQFYRVQSEVAPEVMNSEEIQSLGSWRDNSNNYYLEILAELGLFGFSLLMLAGSFIIYSCFKLREGKAEDLLEVKYHNLTSFGAALSLAVLFVCLLTGPHFYFAEVRSLFVLMLCIVLVDQGGKPKKLSFKAFMFFAATLLLTSSLLFPKSDRSLKGFYQREGQEVWSSLVGEFKVCSSGTAGLMAGNPDIGSNLLKVKLYRLNGKQKNLQDTFLLGDHSWKNIDLTAAKPTWFRFELDRVWSPLAAGISTDARWLGLRFKLPDGLCE